MQTTPTHLASGAIVISVDELTAEDLQHLLDLKRSEPERIRAREEEELRHMLWRLLHRMPAETAAEIAELLTPILTQRNRPHFHAYSKCKSLPPHHGTTVSGMSAERSTGL